MKNALANHDDDPARAAARSLTWDRGKEMSAARRVHRRDRHPCLLRRPAQPWQRGTNENTNGLLRQYFPKGTDLSAGTPTSLAAVAS
jgi:transposase, IS30 family